MSYEGPTMPIIDEDIEMYSRNTINICQEYGFKIPKCNINPEDKQSIKKFWITAWRFYSKKRDEYLHNSKLPWYNIKKYL